MTPHSSSWRSILILSSHQRQGLPCSLFPSGFPTEIPYTRLLSPIRVYYMPRPFNSPLFDHPNNIGWEVQIIKRLIMSFSPRPVTLSLLSLNITLSAFHILIHKFYIYVYTRTYKTNRSKNINDNTLISHMAVLRFVLFSSFNKILF